MRLDVAGAESTVACYLAMLGARVAWVSRVGDDPLGRLVRQRVGSYGVDTALVETDPGAPTGVFFKDPRLPADPGSHTSVHYYRAGSAASRLGPELLHEPALANCRLLHLSGITPALSDSCAEMVDGALTARPGARPVVSFDVNYRPGLWAPATAAPLLAALANRADIAFVGLDEAALLWGAATADEVRALLPGPGRLIVKDGPVGATSFGTYGATTVPAEPVDIVEPVGAGDAFAAGYLFGCLRGLDEPARLRLGHRVAGAALRTTSDVGELPSDLLASPMVAP